MSDPSQDEPGQPHPESPARAKDEVYQEGKRPGAHPLVVVFGVIIGLWLVLWIFIPASKTKVSSPTSPTPSPYTGEVFEGAVMFRIEATIPALRVVTIVVPPQATDSQVAGLLTRFRQARLDQTLSTLLPATTPGHELGEIAIAEIYVFSDPTYAKPEAVEVLARGAHAPGHLYPQAIPFEVAMEQVRGHYRIDLNDPSDPDRASLGFADDSGVHSKQYRPLF